MNGEIRNLFKAKTLSNQLKLDGNGGIAPPSADITVSGNNGIVVTQPTAKNYQVSLLSPVSTSQGGTGATTYTEGSILIGKTDGTLAKSTLTAGQNIAVTNGNGTIGVGFQGVLPTVNGGTGQSSWLNGQIPIGSSLTNGLVKSTLTPGQNISINNAPGAITVGLTGTISSTNGGTGQNTYIPGNLLSGTLSGGLAKIRLTAGDNIAITNADDGNITIDATIPPPGGGNLVDSDTFIIDNVDPTKRIRFEVSPVDTAQTRIITAINEDLTLVGTTNAQTLTNKNITDTGSNVTSNGLRSTTTTVNVSSAVAPSVGQILTANSGTAATWQNPIVTASSSNSFSNKSLIDASTFIIDDVDATKKLRFECSPISTGQTRTVSMINENLTLVGTTNAQTLTNKNITDTGSNVTSNGLRSTTTTVNVSSAGAPAVGQILTATSSSAATWQAPVVSASSSNIFTNKSLIDASTYIIDDVDASKRLRFECSPISTGQTRVISMINEDLTLVGVLNAQTLSNKNFTTDIISLTDNSINCGLDLNRFISTNTYKLNVGPAQSISGSVRTTLTGTDRSINGPHIRSYTSADIFPLHEQLNFGHDDVWYSFDGFFYGTSWLSSHTTAGYAYQKTSGVLRFNTFPSGTANTGRAWTTRAQLNQGGFDRIEMAPSGTLQFNQSTFNTVLNATPTANRVINLPDASGILAISSSVSTTVNATQTGQWGTLPMTVQLERCGNMVNGRLTNTITRSPTSQNSILLSNIIPEAFQPIPGAVQFFIGDNFVTDGGLALRIRYVGFGDIQIGKPTAGNATFTAIQPTDSLTPFVLHFSYVI